jgi:PBSX family phage terminase large subunit
MPSGLVIEKVKGKAPTENPGYAPRGVHRTLMTCHAPIIACTGGAGTGKSRACLEKLHLQAIKYAGMRGAIIRKTRESLTHSAIETYEREVMTPPESIPYNHEDQEYRYPNGSKIIVGGMDKASKVMSSQYDTIYVQEGTELAEEEADILTTRLRNGVIPYQQLIVDCNPSGPDHWINQWCIHERAVRLHSVHEDNPKVTPEYLAQLDRLTGYLYRRLRLGEWCGAEGMFFAEWDERLLSCEPFDIPRDWLRWVGIDYGFADPCAVLWAARNPEEPYHVYLYRELYAKGLRDEQQAKAIVRAAQGERIAQYVADPSVFNKRNEQNRPSIAKVYWTNGLRPLTGGVNSRTMGWQVVRRALAVDEDRRPRLQVMKGRCPNLMRTMPGLVFDPLDSEDLAVKIRGVGTEEHLADSLRYMLVFEQMPARQVAKMRAFRFEA